MTKLNKIALFSLAALTSIGTAEAGQKKEISTGPELVKAVRQKLERLPYYGVFDALTYQVNANGTVELGGSVFRDSLREEAERAVLKVPGVTQVVNQIEELDWGVLDDEIRARVYLTIYRDGFLSRYGTATDQALANGVGYGRGFGVFGSSGMGNPYFPGFNPSGDYGIHILVSNGDVTLVGNVDSEGDKNLAGIKARGVFPVRKVINELTVGTTKPETPSPAALKSGISAGQ